jgi:drug/metabolite transporter (DMT)-like permease
MSPIAAFVIALGGNSVLSLGMVLQKRFVGWIGAKPPRDAAFRRALAGWLAGFMLMNIAPAFNYLALMGLPPNVVGAAAGSSVAFTALLAAPLLGERVGGRRLGWSAALFAAIAAAGLRGSPTSTAPAAAALYAFLALPAALAAVAGAMRRRHRGPRLALVFAANAGSFGGYMVLPMRALQLAGGGSLGAWLATPYPYLFLAGGFGGFILAQLAYKDGEMARVAPVYYGMQVLWPAIGSYFAFASPFDPLQAAAFAAVALCVGMIARG